MGADDVPTRWLAEDGWGGQVMRRLDDGWCAALDRITMGCTIYARRPGVCRDYSMGEGDCLVERARLGHSAEMRRVTQQGRYQESS